MLDWSLIDNDKTFQRLINHLFALECNSPGFIPSSPYIGADGGWDGLFKGSYEGLKGSFSIQAKWTKKNFKPAMASLDQDVKKEIEKAVRNRDEHLRIATNAELRPNQVARLQNLKPPALKTVYVWHRENLTIRIEKQSFLLHHFFGKPQFPSFVPCNLYMRDIESKLLPIPMVGRANDFKRVKKALSSDNSRLVIVHAPGGHGKSHFLKDLCKKVNKAYKSRQPWFVRPGIRKLSDSIEHELVAGTRYVLFLDDADRSLEDVKTLVSHLRFNKSIKAVMSTRSAGLSLITKSLSIQRFEEYSIHQLPRLPEKSLERLLCAAAGKRSVHRSLEIVQGLNSNPHLIVQYGRRIKGDLSDHELENLFGRLSKEVLFDCNQILGNELTEEKQATLLANLATVVPFQIGDVVSLELPRVLQVGPDILKSILDKLIGGRVLRTVGRTIRFEPDMTGDLYLATRLDENPSLSEELLERWFPVTPNRSIANLSAAAPYGHSHSIELHLGKMVGAWIASAGEHGGRQREQNIENIGPAVHLIPDDVLSLIRTYLYVPFEAQDIPAPFDVEEHVPALDLDDYGPIVESLGMLPDYQVETLELVRDLADKSLDGQYDNYKTETLIKSLVSPLKKSPELVMQVLSELLHWCKSQQIGEIEAKLATTAASEILKAAHEYHHSFRDTFTVGERPLLATPEVQKLRDLGLAIFNVLIGKRSPNLQMLALEIAESIGESPMGRTGEADIPLAARVAKDRKTVLERLDDLLDTFVDFGLLSKLENLLFHWWSQEKKGADKALDILSKIPRTPEYRLFRRYIDPDYVIDSMADVSRKAPSSGVWNWWWDSGMHDQWRSNTVSEQGLTKELSDRYVSKPEILDFLIRMNELLEPYDPWSEPKVLEYWVDGKPKAFIALLPQTDWQRVPVRFKGQISSSLAKHRKEHITEVGKEIVAGLPDVPLRRLSDYVRILVENSIPYQDIRDVVLEVAKKGNTNVRTTLIGACYSLLKKTRDKDSFFEIVYHAAQPPWENRLVGELGFCLRATDSWPLKSQDIQTRLKTRLHSAIHTFPKLGHREIEVIKFCLGDAIEMWIQFLDHRFAFAAEAREKGNRRSGFREIPFRGLEHLAQIIRDFAQFDTFMKHVVRWNKKGDPWTFYLGYLLKPLRRLSSSDGETSFLIWMKRQLTSKDKESFEAFLGVIQLCDFEVIDKAIMFQLLLVGEELGMLDKAQSVFRSLLYTGAWSCEIGEIPDPLSHRKTLLNGLIERSRPGQVKTFLKQCLRSVEKRIDNHLAEHEEFLEQR